MLEFLLRRLFAALFTLVAASLVVFGVLEVLPGDPALVMLGMEAQPDTLAALRAELGLDRPMWLRYAQWIGDMLSFDLGRSYAYKTDVATMLAARLQVTVPLAIGAVTFAVLLGLPLGILAAARHNRAGDYGVMMFSQGGIAVPNFWIGLLLVLLFSLTLRWFPAGGFPGWDRDFAGSLKALVLPIVALGLPEAAILARIARSAMLDTMREDYVRTARAKGVSERNVLFRHALRNALIPIVTIVGLFFAFQVGGAIIIESVFYLPGVGQLIYQSINNRDLVIIKNVVILLTFFVLLINLLIDVIYVLVDPRPKIRA
ncbi:MAG: ABC transporter permease [Reyranellaceae bacterium]